MFGYYFDSPTNCWYQHFGQQLEYECYTWEWMPLVFFQHHKLQSILRISKHLRKLSTFPRFPLYYRTNSPILYFEFEFNQLLTMQYLIHQQWLAIEIALILKLFLILSITQQLLRLHLLELLFLFDLWIDLLL